MTADGLPPALWLGGGSGAGKTTISLTIALRFDIAWYRIDSRAYEHHRPVTGHPASGTLGG